MNDSFGNQQISFEVDTQPNNQQSITLDPQQQPATFYSHQLLGYHNTTDKGYHNTIDNIFNTANHQTYNHIRQIINYRIEKMVMIFDQHSQNQINKYHGFNMIQIAAFIHKQNLKFKIIKLINLDRIITNSSIKSQWNLYFIQQLKSILFQSNLHHKSQLLVQQQKENNQLEIQDMINQIIQLKNNQEEINKLVQIKQQSNSQKNQFHSQQLEYEKTKMQKQKTSLQKKYSQMNNFMDSLESFIDQQLLESNQFQ